MSTIVTRAGKGSALTHNEVDANFNNLNNDKIEAAQSVTLTNKTLSTGTAITAGTINNATIGASTPSSGAFTTLSASSTVSGTGFSTYLASPPAIGGTAPAAGSFTTLSATGVTTVQAGTVSAPAITTSGDTNTGIFFPAADTIAFTEGGVESGRFTSTGALQLNSNLTFIGTGNRITGDFSNATLANRVMFQSSTTNGNTVLSLLPNGTSVTTALDLYSSSSDPANSSILRFTQTSTDASIRANISGTGTYLPMTFYTGGSERARIDTSGNVGIGTTSPGGRLDVNGLIIARATGGGEGAQIDFLNPDNASTGLSVDVASADIGRIFSARNNSTLQLGQLVGTGGVVTFHTAANERMRIDSSGNVGIGTSSPAARLDVNGAIYSRTSGVYADTFASYSGGATTFGNGSSYTAFFTASTERARITSGGYFKASNSGAYYGATGSYHELRNSQAGESVVAVTHSGTNPYGQYLDFVGADPNNATNWVFGAYTTSAGVWIYRIYSNGTVAARSDVKWKKNIETARNGYAEDLAKLRVVKYNWYNHDDGTPKELGLIAQEVEQVFPGLVITDEQTRDEVKTREVPAVLDEEGNEVEPARTEEYTEKVGTGEYSKSIKFSVLPIMLLKAIQEQQAMIEEMKAEIQALKGNA